MKSVVNLLLEEWDLGRKVSNAQGDICGWIYLFDILSYADEMWVAVENGEIIGVMGFESYPRPKRKMRKKFYHTLFEKSKKSPDIPNPNALETYYTAYDYCPDELKGQFDGELVIAIVKKSERGRHIGRAVFEHICERARLRGVTRMRIDTDDACNREFYERRGCKCVYETKIKGGENFNAEHAFVYEALLDETGDKN